MGLFDKAIEFISPAAAYRREQYRAAMKVLQERRFDAASRGRRTANLPIGDSSANTENVTQLSVLRSRSRHFERNFSFAKRGFKSISNNTVGTGIIPSFSAGSKAKAKKLSRIWNDWAGKTACDFDGRMNFYGIEKMAMRTVAISGECLIMRRRTAKGMLPIELQVLEPDFLDASRDIQQLPGGGWITQGIEFDSNGKRRGYWLFKSHPLEYGFYESRFVPAEDVLHIYEILRPGQARGVPFIYSAMMRMNDLDDYMDAELVGKKGRACFMAFVQDADPANAGQGGGTPDPLERLEPGIVEYLPPGKQVVFSDPPSDGNYDPYTRSVLREIAAGMDITYEALTGDLSNVNFSSGRMGWIEMHRQVETWQWDMLVPQLCDGVMNWFMDAVELKYGIGAGDTTVTWTAPRREMIDPVKETEAIVTQVRSGLKSAPEAIREQGYEPDQVLEEIKAWNEKLDSNKIKLDSDGRNPANGGGGKQPAEQQAQQKNPPQ